MSLHSVAVATTALLTTALAGCAPVRQALDTSLYTSKERGAAIGVATGAVANGLTGRANGSTARGAHHADDARDARVRQQATGQGAGAPGA